MFCPKCGAKQSEESPKYCEKCGAPLGRNDESDTKSASVDTPSAKLKSKPRLALSKAPNAKLIAIVAAAVLVVVIIAALVVTSCGKPAGEPQAEVTTQPKPTADPEPEPEPDSEPELTTEEKRDFFVGKWVAQDSTDENMPQGWFEDNAAQGVYVTLAFWDDGTGAYRTEDGPTKFTWEAQSATKATADIDGEDVTLVLRGKKLTMKKADGVEIYFVPEDEVDMSNAVDLSQHGFGVTVDPSTIQVDEYSKLIGNESVGYMQIPRGWVNRIGDIDPEFVESYNAVYYVDSTTEYTSPSQGTFAFSQFVEMSRHVVSYEDLAEQLLDAYNSDDKYGDAAIVRMTVGKRRAFCIMSTNEVDNVNVMSIVIDRDNDEKVSVVLSFNCGTISDDKPTEWALAFASTWQVE